MAQASAAQEIETMASTFFPKLRENVWHVAENAKPGDVSYLITSQGQYELQSCYTLNFLKLRPFFTGHYSVAAISRKTNVNVDDIFAFVEAFQEIGLIYPETPLLFPQDPQQVRDSLMRIVSIWAQELHSVYIANELARDGLSKTVLVGWMIEMYHYVRDFPAALKHGADRATGNIKMLLDRYASEEMNHEEFVLQSLVKMGMDWEEVKGSVPLVSTRTIGLLLRELLELEPAAALLVAALLEAADFDEKNIHAFKKRLSELYNISEDALDPYFKHQKIDYDLGHQKLLADNLDLITITDLHKLDEIVNKLHDLKHAFELQSLEIKSYYGEPLNGRYFPRQRMTYQGI